MYDILPNCSEFYIVFRRGGLARRKAFVNGIKILLFTLKIASISIHILTDFLSVGD